MRLLFLIILSLFFVKPELYSQEIKQELYFVSGIYQNDSINQNAFSKLSEDLAQSTNPKTLVFLGDYHSKVSEEGEDEDKLMGFLDDLPQSENINYVFIPGFEEWDRNNSNSSKTIDRLNSEIAETLEGQNYMLADNACPGPYELSIDENLTLVLINDYWLLNDFDVPKAEQGCSYTRKVDFLLAIEEILKRNANKRVIFSAINPIASSGPVGGKFKLKHHIFPFSIKNHNNYIPLPLLGSFYIAYRKLLGNPNDLSNVKSRFFRKYLRNTLSKSQNLLLITANEDHLDYRTIENLEQVIIGSLSGSSYSKFKSDKGFNSTSNGYVKVIYGTDNSLRIELQSSFRKLFEKKIFPALTKDSIAIKNEYSDYENTTVNASADKDLKKANKKRPGLMGLNYRKEWITEIKEVPVFNWGKEYGGLEIVKKGGGMQTRSLRLETTDDKQYVLRSIKKYPENAVPAEIRGTIFAEIINDQISASHPYAAFAVPKLADAANVYHTNPKMVYLNDDPRLGDYKFDFANGLYLYEERPAHERKDVKSFGSPRDIESTFDIVEKTQKSSKHQIDQKWVVKSRLFDMWLGDWDRHDDQWRWAEFKVDDEHKFYRPIPRDRDQAFFYSDGLLLNLASRKWGIPKFQGFESEIRDVNGLSFNARYFDRYFITEPDLSDWIASADTLQQKLSDQVIEAGIKDLPKEIYDLGGDQIIKKLKRRRDDLKIYAENYHKFLSKTVNVLGTNKANRFDVQRLENGNTLVEVYEVGKKSRKEKDKLYQREFVYGITKEIRLYGLKGKDEFNLEGNSKKGIKVRIIGGGGKDKIRDNSEVKGIIKKTIVYDKKKSTEIEKSSETKNKTSNRDDVNEYNRRAFKYNKLMPFVFINYNPDDGIYLGGGPIYTTHGFRKEPFKNQHSLLGNIAPKSANYNVNYSGIFTDLAGKLDLNIEALISTPSFSTFFYGLGNNTLLNEERLDNDNQYYRVRFDTERLKIGFQGDSRNQKHRINFGLGYQRAHVKAELNEDEDDDPRFILDLNRDSTTNSLLRDFRFAGPYFEYQFDSRNDRKFAERGMLLNLKSNYFYDIKEGKENSILLSADQSFYFTLSHRFKTVLALRAGADAIIGKTPFFLVPSIGGLKKLRGFRRNRFRGEYTFYQNTELRFRLFTIQNEFLISDFGILLLHDIGRVWSDKETDLTKVYNNRELAKFKNTNDWHRGYGFGIWLAPFDMAVLSADYSFGNGGDQSLFIRLGFLF